MISSNRNQPRRRPLRFMNPAFYTTWLANLFFRPSWQRKYRAFRK